jgi:hypothetical protein
MTDIFAQTGSGIAGPPYKLRQNETAYWEDVSFTDRFDNEYDSLSYTLTYVFAPQTGSAGIFQIVAAPGASDFGTEGTGGSGWITQLTATQATLLTPGLWSWQAWLSGTTQATFTGSIAGNQLTVTSQVGDIEYGSTVAGVGVAANTLIVSGSNGTYTVSVSQNVGPIAMTATLPTRVMAAEGELTVEMDLATVSGSFDPRSQWEIILANCETALAVFQASGGRVKEYEIQGRRMAFDGTNGIIALHVKAQARVNAEKFEASGGDNRNIRIGFAPASSGVPTDSSKNWPWW